MSMERMIENLLIQGYEIHRKDEEVKNEERIRERMIRMHRRLNPKEVYGKKG